ncbi:MAG: biotin/lipoyl-binding protein [Peptococcaceae bacterium]|nr:biotin/lipoyl-binding protein [Peptococcaceae bacterium]
MKRFMVSIHDKEYEVGVRELGDDDEAPEPPAPGPVGHAARAPVLLDQNGGAVTSPIPGVVASILVEAGTAVRKGETLLILEAMKMENDIVAVRDGVVVEIRVAEGQSVKAQEILLLID